jgi:carbon-monoxide dehydrogenase catalytic subunit
MAVNGSVRNFNEVTSAHASTQEMIDWTCENCASTVFDRFKMMQPQCEFGKLGVCCRLCSLGPCRINGSKMGACGASADTIIARNLLQLVTIGASIYLYEAELAAKTLRTVGRGESMFQIRDTPKLVNLARDLGLHEYRETHSVALGVADAFLNDLRRDHESPPIFLKMQSPASRQQRWKALGILPGGALVELRDALAKSATSVDGDPTDLIFTALRLSIATGFSGLLATNVMNDIMLGTPTVTESPVDLGVLDETSVNIVAHGHDPYMATAVLHLLHDRAVQTKAKATGASGIKLYGSACVGQELLQRAGGSAQGVAGLVGNCPSQEMMIATGLVDLVMLDLNCAHPGLKTMADRFHTKLVPVSHLVHLEGLSGRFDYTPQHAREQAMKLINLAIDAYRHRNGNGHRPSQRQTALSGFCAESIAHALGGALDPLIAALKEGSIKGIVAVVGCTTVRGGHGANILALTRELIQRDILVINSGCCSGATQLAGLMHPSAASEASPKLRALCESLHIPPCLNFGACTDVGRIAQTVIALGKAMNVDPSQLPVAVSAPEYFDQKALCDGFFAVALGLLTHIAPMPPVGNDHRVTRMLTSDLEELTGGKLLPELDMAKAAETMEGHIEAKRRALGMVNG